MIHPLPFTLFRDLQTRHKKPVTAPASIAINVDFDFHGHTPSVNLSPLKSAHLVFIRAHGLGFIVFVQIYGLGSTWVILRLNLDSCCFLHKPS